MADTEQAARSVITSVSNEYEGATPLMRQYFATRREHPGILLLMRVGDFHEAYGPDAETIAQALQVTLTGREDGGTRIPMAGVPYHATERYVARLVAAGHRVAIMEQVEDPKLAKGLVKRRVTRVITPGTVLEDALLDARSNNYLVAAVTGDPVAGIGVVDVSTGEFLTTEMEGEHTAQRLLEEIARLEPAEILVPEDAPLEWQQAVQSLCSAPITPCALKSAHTRAESSKQILLQHFQTSSLRGFGCEEYTAGLDACAMLLQYLQHTQQQALPHIRTLATYSTRDFMILDAAARRHLEITTPLGDGGRQRTLLGVLDETLTPMGGRLLRRRLEEPLLDVERINQRLDGVEEMVRSTLVRGDVRDLLKGMGDMERLTSRCAAGIANGRDLLALKTALLRLPELAGAVQQTKAHLLQEAAAALASPMEIAGRIAKAIADDPPAGLREGGLIRNGYNDELDSLRTLAAEARAYIANLETSERERTGITSLKVGYNAVFGYYLEITRANLSRVPENYMRKQTTAGGERYITPELKEAEARVLNAEEKMTTLEYELFIGVREHAAHASPQLLQAGRAVAELDVLSALAESAVRSHYTRPVLHEENTLEIAAGRHPVIERLAARGSYIPNDCSLNPDCRLVIITGPNMSGKSSFLRQTALITLMAQAGCFVPADKASIGIVDRIFTRVGAHDELASGQSTFMVEMNETAVILNNATPRSLVALDEIGRGTSTFDGLSIAWAVAEYLARLGCKTLFATHYHHLNELASQMEGVKNFRVAVREQEDRIVWLHKLVPGGTDRSYGIHVARMAGIPPDALERAEQILRTLERGSAGSTRDLVSPQTTVSPRRQKLQLTLFEQEQHPLLEELKNLDVSTLSPLEALMLLDKWKRNLSSQE